MKKLNPQVNSKPPQSVRSLETITRYAGLGLVIFLLSGPASIVLARVLARVLPLSAFIGTVTSYSPARIRSENVRIVTEGGDYLFFILFLILVGSTISTFLFVLCYSGDKIPRVKQLLSRFCSTKYLYQISLILVFLHFASLHKWRTEAFGQTLLDGFGMGPAIVALGISIVLNKYRNNLFSQFQKLPKSNLQKILFFLTALIFIPQISAFGGTIGSNREFGIVFNEYAAPAAGLHPFQNFVPTYTSLAGYVVQPVIALTGNANIIRVSIVYHMLLSIVLISILIWFSKQILRCNLVLAALIAAVLISPRSNVDQALGFLPSTSNAIRFLIPLLVLAVASYFFKKRKPSVSFSFLLGVLLALSVINNTEIGVPLVLSLLITLGLKVFADGSFVRNFLAVTLIAITTFTGVLYLMSDGQLMQGGQDWLLWMTSRGSGGYINAVPVWGLHQFAFSIHSVTLLFGLLIVISKKGKDLTSDLKENSLIGIATGLFGITTFPYFLGANGPNFIPTTLWLPFVLSTLSLIGILKVIWLSIESQPLKIPGANSIHFSPLHFGISSVLLCSLMFVPDPQNLVGIHFRRDAVTWTTETFMSEPVVESIVEVMTQKSDASKIAYFGEYGNLISLLTGIDSVYGVHDPMIAYSSRKSVAVTCRPLKLLEPNLVYASKRFLPVQFLDSSFLNGPCPGLLRDPKFESEFLIRYVYTPLGE